MTWLNGLPRATRNLSPPQEVTGPRGISVLDDRVLLFFCEVLPNKSWKTRVYLVDLRDEEARHFRTVAEIPIRLSMVELLPRNEGGFVSAELEAGSATFRIHSQDGNVVKHISFPVVAAYGNLVVEGETISLCISSGNPPTDMAEFNRGLQDVARGVRIGERSHSTTTNAIPDQIVVWDHGQETFEKLPILQDPKCPMLHSANFRYITPNIIALAGAAEGTYGIDAGLLRCFSIKGPPYTRTFAQSPHTSRDLIQYKVGKPGSSQPSDIFGHIHDGGRISIFHRDLLSGQLPSSPVLNSYNLLEATLHPSYHRAIKGEVNNLACFSENRVLIVAEQDPNFEDDQSPVAMIIDFDQGRVGSIVSLDSSSRQDLESRLSEENARVRVITRRYNVNAAYEEDDAEYPYPLPPNVEWEAHLRQIYLDGVARLEEGSEPPALEFEEPPINHRSDTLFGFVESRVQIPDNIDPRTLVMTSSVLISIPENSHADWVIFFFDD